MSEITSALVEIEMTETVYYTATMTVQEFAALVRENPEGMTVGDLRAYVEDNPSSDYGVDGADGLLDEMVSNNFDRVEDREWFISIGGDAGEEI